MRSYPHMCRMDHVEIGHSMSDEDERCPLCRALDEGGRLREENELLRGRLVSRDEALRHYEDVVCFDSMWALRGGAVCAEVDAEKVGTVLRERYELREENERLRAALARALADTQYRGGFRDA